MTSLYRGTAIADIRSALARSDAAGLHNNQGLKGRAREVVVSKLLDPYLGPSVETCLGVVVDCYGNSSRQIDIIVYDESVAPAREGVVPYESTLATVEVKTELTASELKKSILNARSVKALDPTFLEVQPPREKKKILSPACYVFAFSSGGEKVAEELEG